MKLNPNELNNLLDSLTYESFVEEEKEESSTMNDLFNFDFSNLDFKKAIDFKLKVISLRRELDNFINKQSKGFDEVTNGAYGYIHNPYKRVREVAQSSIDRCDYIINQMKEEDLYYFIDAPMNLSVNLLFGSDYSYHFGSSDTKDVIFKKGMLALKDAMQLYQDAHKKKHEIFQKYLGFVETEDIEDVDVHYIIDDETREPSFKVIKAGDEKLHYNSFGIDSHNWTMWESHGTIDISSTKFRKLNKKYFPEYFV